MPSVFPYFRFPDFIDSKSADAILEWFSCEAPWKLRIEHFYQQYEFSLLTVDLPDHIRQFVEDACVNRVRSALEARLGASGPLELIDISAHRLVPGQTIKIHNDHLGGEETHRFLIQINKGWSRANGGILMLFSSHLPDDLADIVEPMHRSGFGFKISERSFHAVSTVRAGDRFTLVYTFRESLEC